MLMMMGQRRGVAVDCRSVTVEGYVVSAPEGERTRGQRLAPLRERTREHRVLGQSQQVRAPEGEHEGERVSNAGDNDVELLLDHESP